MDKTKQKIQELVPEIMTHETIECTRDWSAWKYGTMKQNDFEVTLGRPITLTDVLLAMMRHTDYQEPTVEELGNFIVQLWDLTKTYDDQSQETKDFIGEILQANK